MDLKQLILDTDCPLVIKNRSKCNLLSWTIEDWTKAVGQDLLEIRCGKTSFTEEPQWDKTCTIKKVQFKDFFEEKPGEFWYFDYKHLCQWFKDKEDLRQQIDWSELGFPELKADDSTIWIGTKGAHTPCHQDTYGTNMVLQLYGKKLWLLWPPGTPDLNPTRFPFEESSIFSKLNFFSPNFQPSNGCFMTILEPGDVLVVPHKWWHYVENLEFSISVNAWLPHCRDNFERIKESVATILMKQFYNSDSLISINEALNIIQASKSKKSEKENRKIIKNDKDANIVSLQWLNETEFNEFLKNQKNRFKKEEEVTSTGQSKTSLHDLLDAIMSDDVLDLIANKLIKN
ncbi:unnamed protein product [Ceutorhynchus assimilis]|uniref:JmjC domain-containing protein n=1 Tax=Ceutorhynchus assimilis TaxID=467358 RepID=A0A9N9MFT3_9CUCU|nr:unnamed protein product [Ceutorhynchus assimilis]